MCSLAKDIGIDLGTASVLVYVKGKGVVLREPSVVAMDKNTGKLLKVGTEAQAMLGRTPGSVTAIRPLKDGVIADFYITEEMLRYFIKKATSRYYLIKPRVLIAIPSGITEVERRAVKESAEAAGARRVHLIEELISLSGIVYSRSVRCAGDELDDAIISYMRRTYNLMVGERTAEDIKIRIGSAYPLPQELSIEVKGRDLVAGLPKTVTIRSEEVREALTEQLNTIVDAVRTTLERCPPELAADLVDRGIVLAGGGALLRGLDQLLHEQTGLPIHIAEDPLSAVAEGTGKALQELDFFTNVTDAED